MTKREFQKRLRALRAELLERARRLRAAERGELEVTEVAVRGHRVRAHEVRPHIRIVLKAPPR